MPCGFEPLIVLLPVLPGTVVLWPVMVAAAAAAATTLGYAAVRGGVKAKVASEIDLAVGSGQGVDALQADVVAGETRVFSKDDVQLVFCRHTDGTASLKARSTAGRSEAELRTAAEAFLGRLTQQYAYHRLMTKLRQEHFSVVDETTDDQGRVHLQVSVYRE
jgi:hypothetical protein